MSLHRYFMYISYIGKPFRGAQRQVRGGTPRADDLSTVQGRLELGLKQLNPCNEPIIYLSSRTDKGVHAISSTCHVDLYRKNGFTYDPRTVTICMNKYFKREDVPIRVLKTYIVPNEFHSRHNAIMRTYMYRILVGKTEGLNVAPNFKFIPIEEWDRCLFYCTSTFEIEAMREASKLFEGLHDFRTFMAQSPNTIERETRRSLEKIEVVERIKYGYSDYSWPQYVPSWEDYKFIDVYIQSRGFLYKQVRRTVATLIAAAQGKVTLRDIKFMLEVPSAHSWLPQIKTVPAHGLYLCEVRYSQEDLGKFRDCIDNGGI